MDAETQTTINENTKTDLIHPIFRQSRLAGRDSALRRLKLALLVLAGTGERRDFLFVREVFQRLRELRGC